MSRATLDLPDPIDSPVLPVPPVAPDSHRVTDDLLDQWVEEEIDRFLTEAKSDHPVSPIPATPLHPQLDSLFETIRPASIEPSPVLSPMPARPEVVEPPLPLREVVVASMRSPAAEELPMLLRPLAWLSRPLASRPPWIRRAVGIAAVIALTAAMILLAVALWRRG